MTITDFRTPVSDTAETELPVSPEMFSAGMEAVRELHPGYKFTYSNEIRCDGWACSRFMDIAVEGITRHTADRVYAEHLNNELKVLIAGWNEPRAE